MTNKVKIVLDADVLIHFSKGERMTLLKKVFPNYDLIVLNIVYHELKGDVKIEVGNHFLILKDFLLIDFGDEKDLFSKDMRKEYVKLTCHQNLGKGESACMAYCKYTNNVVGSSNLKDIANYCTENNITYLTTIDFLYYAYKKKLMTLEDCNKFIKDVKSKGSKLPDINIAEYIPRAIL